MLFPLSFSCFIIFFFLSPILSPSFPLFFFQLWFFPFYFHCLVIFLFCNFLFLFPLPLFMFCNFPLLYSPFLLLFFLLYSFPFHFLLSVLSCHFSHSFLFLSGSLDVLIFNPCNFSKIETSDISRVKHGAIPIREKAFVLPTCDLLWPLTFKSFWLCGWAGLFSRLLLRRCCKGQGQGGVKWEYVWEFVCLSEWRKAFPFCLALVRSESRGQLTPLRLSAAEESGTDLHMSKGWSICVRRREKRSPCVSAWIDGMNPWEQKTATS